MYTIKPVQNPGPENLRWAKMLPQSHLDKCFFLLKLGTDECFSISGNSTEVEAPPAAVWPPDQTSPKNHEVPTVAQGRLTCSDLFYFDLLEPVKKENERFNAHCKNLYTPVHRSACPD